MLFVPITLSVTPGLRGVPTAGALNSITVPDWPRIVVPGTEGMSDWLIWYVRPSSWIRPPAVTSACRLCVSSTMGGGGAGAVTTGGEGLVAVGGVDAIVCGVDATTCGPSLPPPHAPKLSAAHIAAI